MAFWKFGKKKLDDKAKTAIETAAFIIHLQMKPSTGPPGFDEAFNTAFSRGYLTGAFMAAMQAFQIPGYGDHTKTIAFVVGGHVSLIGEKQGLSFAMDSIGLQGNEDYEIGNRVGGQELIDFLNKEIIMPNHLLKYFEAHCKV